MRIALPTINDSSDDPQSIIKQLRNIVSDLESQINQTPNVVSGSNNKIPQGTQRHDIIVRYIDGVLRIGIFDGKRFRALNATDLQAMQKTNTQFLGLVKVDAAAPALADFPNPNDWGFYDRTGIGMLLCYHRESTGTLSSIVI